MRCSAAIAKPVDEKRRVKKMWNKLQNPFVLVGQGFLLGGILFFATHGDNLSASPAAAPVEAAR